MESIKKWLKENRITEIECLVPDMTGNARGKFIPASKFIRQESPRLPESILIQTVTGDWADEHDELVDPADRDMVLQPDANTIRLVPWATEPTAQIIHDCHDMQGNLHPLSTRNVLRRVLAKFEAEGLQPVTAPELEFYLIKQNADPTAELQPPIGRSGRPEVARQSYSIDAVNEFEEIFEAMYDYCEAQRLDVDSLIHESGVAQFEINFLHGDALNLADQVFTFKRTMRETALRHNVYATFMSKPMCDEPGSSMHIHQSLINKSTGKNIFAEAGGEKTQAFRHYLGGMQKYTPQLLSFFAPNVNAYRRFAKDLSAPVNLNWGYDNRTTGLRVPISSPAGTRIENRFSGADANPYLALAASLASGYLGMKNKIEPTAASVGSSYDEEITVPRSLEEGLRGLDEYPEMVDLIGEQFITAYRAVKLQEYETFNQVISSWEREFLLLNV